MYAAMLGALDEASADASIACVLVSGEGGIFTAGNDIGDFIKGAMSSASADESTAGGRFIRALARFEKPIVAAVEGQAIGIGTTLCFHCDLVYAAPSARFQMPFVNLGLVPEAGSSRLATMRFGVGKASEMLLLGEAFDAATAHEIGFVNAIVPAETLYAHAMEKAQALAATPAEAVRTLAARRAGSPLRAYGGRTRRILARAPLARSARGLHGVHGEGAGIKERPTLVRELDAASARSLGGGFAYSRLQRSRRLFWSLLRPGGIAPRLLR